MDEWIETEWYIHLNLMAEVKSNRNKWSKIPSWHSSWLNTYGNREWIPKLALSKYVGSLITALPGPPKQIKAPLQIHDVASHPKVSSTSNQCLSIRRIRWGGGPWGPGGIETPSLARRRSQRLWALFAD